MKKRINIQKFIPIFVIAMIGIGLLAHSYFSKDRDEFIRKRSQQYTGIAWPAIGEGAIGSVADGLLARSSDNEELLPTASMAKVITALAIMEKQSFKTGQQGQIYSVTNNDLARFDAYRSQGASVLPIVTGMKLTQYQAMQRMLMASDNTVADILVERIFGSMEAYILYAQKMLKRMGVQRTLVADACGFNPRTVSTPSELVTIGIAALGNPVIRSIVNQQRAQLPVAGTIKNTNQLLGMDGIIGIKTGTTDEAGSCLLFAAGYTDKDRKKGLLVGVIMGDANHGRLYSDSRTLLASARRIFGTVGERRTVNFDPPSSKQLKKGPGSRKLKK